MTNGMTELRDAMKESKFRNSSSELRQLFTSANDVDEAIQLSLNVIVNSIRAEAGTFWYYERFGDENIYPRKAFGGEDIGSFHLRPGEGIAGTVIETGEGTIVYDCRQDSRWENKVDSATGFRTKSMICVPVRIRKETFGCIQIINKTDDSFFDDRDLSFAETLAGMISELFVERHLLPEYEQAFAAEGSNPDAPFLSLTAALQENTQKKMENMLLDAEWFNRQSPKKQYQIMSHMDELWKLMHKLK